MLIDDERDLAAGLHALTAAAEPLSGTLAERSIRRARANRQRRLAFTGAVVVAALVVAVPVTATLRAPRASLPLARSLARWPDGRTPAYAAAADVARGEFERLRGTEVPTGTVRWLYAGPVPDTGGEVLVAWAYCAPTLCTHAVMASTTVTYAFRPGPGLNVSNWTWHDGPVDPVAPTAPLSTFLPGEARGHGGTNFLVVLPPRGTDEVRWSSAAARPGTGGEGALSRHGVLFTGNIGYVSAPVRLSVDGHDYAVAVAGDDDPPPGSAPSPGAVTVPPPYEEAFSGDHQTSTPSSFAEQQARGRHAAVYARCEGVGPVRFTLGRAKNALVCDGQQHAVFIDQPVSGEVFLEVDAADPYTTVSYALGYRP